MNTTGMHPSVIDLSILADVIGDDPAKLHKFAHKFVETSRSALAELRDCLAAGDLARIRELGHRVKSAARIVGALGMGDLCERLEKLPAQDSAAELAQAHALIDQIPPLLDRIEEAIPSHPSP
jgi:HPt (histidine-containing phosphotransfer) domain-containing protein